MRHRLVLGLAMGLVLLRIAHADTTSFTDPQTCTNVGALAAPAIWNTPNEARIDNNTLSETGSLTPTNPVSNYLQCTNLGFRIPKGCVIDDIAMQIEHSTSAAQNVADEEVRIVRDDVVAGADQKKDCSAPANFWPFRSTPGTNVPAVTYANSNWGVTWGSCNFNNVQCHDPSRLPIATDPYNVNHQNFGVAVKARRCATATAQVKAQVDFTKVQVTYTVPSCGGQAWGAITVLPSDPGQGAMANYAITTTLPDDVVNNNKGGCALAPASIITIVFPAGTDVSGVTGTMNGATITPTLGAATLSFPVPATLLVPCAGSGQCLEAGSAVTIALSNVRNPPNDIDATLTLSASPTLNGATGTTTSNPYVIATPCVPTGGSASHWETPQGKTSPITVTLTDNTQSLTGCPRFTHYKLETKVPTAGGCKLLSTGTTPSALVVTFPPGSDVAHVMNVSVNGTAVAATDLAMGSALSLTVNKVAAANGGNLTLELDAIQNPSATGSPTLSLQAVNTRKGAGALSLGSTANDASAPYTIAAAPTVNPCAPKLDFYVRDWTDTPNFDSGNQPSNPVPADNWARTSDVWNQYTPTNPTVAVTDWVRGKEPTNQLNAKNYAFARISLKPAATPPAPTFGRTVTAKFYAAPFGMSTNFGLVGEKPIDLAFDSPPSFVNLDWSTFIAGLPTGKLCLATEIVSPSDPLTSPSILNTAADQIGRNNIEMDNNQAQRNLHVVATPEPNPPPAPPMAGGAGPMSHFAIAHNGTNRTREIVYRLNAPPDVLEHLRDPKVEVVGVEGAMPFKPGELLRLPAMRPAEDRTIAVTYTLAPGAEGKTLPIGLSELSGEAVVAAVTFGVQPSPMEVVVAENIRLHETVFGRLGSVFGVGEAKGENAAAAKLARQKTVSDEQYVRFLKDHQRSIDAAVNRFVKDGGAGDAFGLAETLRSFDERVASGNPKAVAHGHLALLEKLDAAQTMRWLAKGNPFDVVQLVRWQRELYSTRPELKALPASAAVVKESQAFLDGVGTRKSESAAYAKLVGDLQKSFQATGTALKKNGVDLAPQLAAMQRQMKAGTASLEKAHREYLLALDDLGAGSAAQQTAR